MKEFPKRRTSAPTRDRLSASLLGFMEFPDQSGENVRGLEVVVVIWPIHVGGHGADKVAPVLPSVGLAHLDARDFGYGIPLIGGFEVASKQVFFFQRLRREPGINAGTAQKQQLF